MKLKHSLSLMALAVCAAASTSALAQTGTITINGEIVADSCTANISSSGGSGSGANFTVNLDPVSYSTLTAGATPGEKPFTIELTGCTVSAGTTSMWAHFTGPQVNGDGRLNTTGTAPVTFQLTDGFGGAPIVAGGSAASGGPGANQGSGATFSGTNPNQTASKQYAVRYYAESTVAVGDAGALSSQVTYNIQYF